MMKRVRYAIVAPIDIQWLFAKEPDVFAQIEKYASDQGDDNICVAGPADPIDAWREKHKGVKASLPTVVLYLRRGIHSETRVKYIEVACSETDLMLINRWRHMNRKRMH